MAGLTVHLMIAKKIIDLLPQGVIHSDSLFYAGSIGPDAIHMRENYVRPMKKHTHLRDDIEDDVFLEEENIEIFYERVKQFIEDNQNINISFIDIYRGYVVHLLTDELYYRWIRAPFTTKMAQLGISQNSQEFIRIAIEEMNRHDFLLMERHEEMKDILKTLEQATPFAIGKYITEDEMDRSIDWVVEWFSEKQGEIALPEYSTVETMDNFITMAAEDILERLTNGLVFPPMF